MQSTAKVIQLRSPSGLLSDFEMYGDHLAGKQRSPRTIESYLDAVTHLDRFLTDRDHSRRTEDVTRKDIPAFIAAMGERYAPGTVSIRFNSIRAFFSWASQEDGGAIIEGKSPMHRLTAPRPPLPPVKVLDADAMRLLLEAAKGRDLASRRDTAMFLLMFDSGMRRNECGDLRVEDVETSSHTALIRRGKGGKSRTVAFGPKTSVAIQQYLRTRRLDKNADDPRLWLGRSGPTDGRAINRVFSRRCIQAGLVDAAGKPIYHPHTARHGFADAVLRSGIHETEAMILGGWASREMLGRYGRELAAERARESYQRHGAPSDLNLRWDQIRTFGVVC